MSRISEALQYSDQAPRAALSSIECDTFIDAPSKTAAQQPTPAMAAPSPAAGGIECRQLPMRIEGTSPLLPFDDTHWYASEQYRIARTRILQHPAQPKVILVTSADSGDGKSVSAINLAGVMSLKSDATVVLADCDFRRSSLHKQLGLPDGPGLSEVLTGACGLEQALIKTEQFPNLYVLTAGSSGKTVNPAELLDSPRWKELSKRLRNTFRHVILDSPPFGRVADYDLLQSSADGIVVVVRPDHTRRSVCLKMLDSIPRERLLGVVLNCVEDWFLARPYHYKMADYRGDQ